MMVSGFARTASRHHQQRALALMVDPASEGALQ
jgi:hypothetical protein